MIKEADIKIRRGRHNDFKELFKILNETPELQTDEKGKSYSKEWIMDSLTDKKRNLVIIAERNKKLIGLLVAELWEKKKSSFLVNIFVKKDYRGRGIATILIKKYEKICRKYKIIHILGLVLITNKKMQKFMGKYNYKKGNKFYVYEKKLK